MPESGMRKLREFANVTCWPHKGNVTHQGFLEGIVGKDGIYCSLNDTVNKEALDAAGPNLKVVSTMSVGFNHIDLEECKKRGIRVGYNPEVLTDATAELTMALLLCTSRRLSEAIDDAKNGGWSAWEPAYMVGPGLAGATVGIVGFGRIGQAVARRLKGFQPSRFIYLGRSDKPEAKEFDAKRVNFDTLLKESDFVISCIPLSPETKQMFNKDAFGKMKSRAIFVNTSRGDVVDQDALVEALTNKTIFGAGLDVTTPEPLPLDHPLFKLKNCVVLPHIGSATIETRETMSQLTVNNIITALQNKPMPAELK